jgi:hypothetical protein
MTCLARVGSALQLFSNHIKDQLHGKQISTKFIFIGIPSSRRRHHHVSTRHNFLIVDGEMLLIIIYKKAIFSQRVTSMSAM